MDKGVNLFLKPPPARHFGYQIVIDNDRDYNDLFDQMISLRPILGTEQELKKQNWLNDKKY